MTDKHKKADITRQIEELLQADGAHSPEQLREAARLLELFAANMEEAHLKKETSAAAYGLYATQYIRTHFNESVKVQELAAHIGISRGYLSDLCKRTVGMSPQEYLLKCRMDYAKNKLAHTGEMIRDIALGCGYEDSLTFSKTFRRKIGISPSEYRKKYKDA